jgi:hypothetical protein
MNCHSFAVGNLDRLCAFLLISGGDVEDQEINEAQPVEN